MSNIKKSITLSMNYSTVRNSLKLITTFYPPASGMFSMAEQVTRSKHLIEYI